jgi:hypothetical protein
MITRSQAKQRNRPQARRVTQRGAGVPGAVVAAARLAARLLLRARAAGAAGMAGASRFRAGVLAPPGSAAAPGRERAPPPPRARRADAARTGERSIARAASNAALAVCLARAAASTPARRKPRRG